MIRITEKYFERITDDGFFCEKQDVCRKIIWFMWIIPVFAFDKVLTREVY